MSAVAERRPASGLASSPDAAVLRFASGDQRRAVLGRKQTNDFREATEEYVRLMQEAIEYKFEPQGQFDVKNG
jgi:TATA-box binding protein (TBP) (component of TFIID and TFIIIB)